ncbi:MAG TPA: multiheme c-type cytochrome [Pontiella sp.]
MKVTKIIAGVGVCIFAISAAFGEGDPSKLVGIKKCAMCHKKDETGNQYAKWQTMGHSKAFDRLGTEEAKAVAAKLGIDDPQTSGKCLKCHSTAYFFTEEKQTEEVAVENGVACQSCHGPGADYKQKSVMVDRDAAIANGMVYPAKEKSCTKCHNDTSPTWKNDRYTLPSGEKVGFDVDQAYEKIKHERPTAE